MNETTQAIILGILEGLTEFIPVSSTGHLILVGDLMGFVAIPGFVFEIVIQFGAILAVCMAYFKRLTGVVATLNEKPSQHFVRNILLAFLPAAIIGVMAHSYIKEVLFSPLVVSISLVTGGIIIIFIERLKLSFTTHEVESMTPALALKIGFCQCLAMIPGVSRSGATIMGAMCFGVSRKAATEFSFFLAIPTMLGAATYDLYKNMGQLSADDIELVLIGFVCAFFAALLVVTQVIRFVERHGFTPFGYYRIIIGSIMLVYLLA